MIKKLIKITGLAFLISLCFINLTFAQEGEGETVSGNAAIEDRDGDNAEAVLNPKPTYLQALINTDDIIEIQKSTIFDASQSFLPDPEADVSYFWDFGDGNKDEGVEVLHAYKTPGSYTVKLTIDDGITQVTESMDIFAYRKLVILITDQTGEKSRIEGMLDFAEGNGVYIKLLESYGSSTEFISEEVLTNKLTEQAETIKKASQIIVWTKENSGLNALSRFVKNNKKLTTNLSQKSITNIIEGNIDNISDRIQNQFDIIRPNRIIVTKEAAIHPLIESLDDSAFLDTLEKGSYEYRIINEQSGKIKPWKFMSYFVNLLIESGVPDNTIALLLLLPVIATIVAVMRQVVGITTFGIYTPSIITLSFLIIGMYAGLITLATAILIGFLARIVLKKVRMLFIPKMAIVITVVSLILFLIIILSVTLQLFDANFLSIAIFPMLILSTLVEKFVATESGKGLSSSLIVMFSTILVSIIAYFLTGGEINLGFATLRFNLIKNVILSLPELLLILIVLNILLGKWSGLRILERIRFREVLRHIEE